jgi:energy-coupling factor transporter ATP-binding protein EcfA2
MKIISIELKGFERMSLSNITLFQMKPTQRTQLILGTNGSGKSSLLNELTPLPALKEAYHPGGYKKITIEHNGHHYVLENNFGPQPYHRFEKDGVNLNAEVGTLLVQRELVHQEFGITQQLHDIMTGQEKFTRMSPAARRELLTKLCETDFTYGISLYNRIKERHRDILGALKDAKRRLVIETGKIIKQEEIDRLKLTIDDLVEKLNHLYSLRNDERRSVAEVQTVQDQLMVEMTRTCERFFKLRGTVFRDHTWVSPQEVEEELTLARAEAAHRSGRMDALHQEFTRLKQTADAYHATGAVGVAQLREQLLALEARRQHLVDNSRLKLVFERPAAARLSLDASYEELLALFSELPSNEDQRFSRSKLQALENQRTQLLEKIDRANGKLKTIQQVKDHFDHLRSGEQTTCPSCQHRWFLGFTEEKYANTLKNLEAGADYIATTQRELAQVEEDLARARTYQAAMNSYQLCMTRHPALNPFWQFLVAEGLVARAPKAVVTKLQALHDDLDDWQQIVKIDDDIRKNHSLMEMAAKASDLDIGRITQRMTEIENDLGTLAGVQRQAQRSIEQNTAYLKRIEELYALEAQVRAQMTRIDQGSLDLARSLNNQIVNDCLRQLNLELSEKQRALNDVQNQRGIIDNIQATVDTLVQEEAVYKLLASELSPHDGLIAEGMLGFIRVMVSKMNQLIRRSWAYPMVILDCSTEADSADLDYKFPVRIADNVKPVKDIGRTSAGQEEMINLAFRIVAMTYAKLDRHWLFLDEFGANMDPGHKEKTVVMIKALLEQLPFSQLYMVSHDPTQYMALTNVEVCVLNSLGITVPGEHNTHVTIQ